MQDIFSQLNRYLDIGNVRRSSPPAPQIADGCATLLCDYQVDNVWLDVYGTHDESGYYVESVALRGTKHDLTDLISPTLWTAICDYCNEELESWEEIQEDLRDEARANY